MHIFDYTSADHYQSRNSAVEPTLGGKYWKSHDLTDWADISSTMDKRWISDWLCDLHRPSTNTYSSWNFIKASITQKVIGSCRTTRSNRKILRSAFLRQTVGALIRKRKKHKVTANLPRSGAPRKISPQWCCERAGISPVLHRRSLLMTWRQLGPHSQREPSVTHYTMKD